MTLAGGVLAALATFLDYAGRAARHHAAAVKYKAIIRELEQDLTGALSGDADDNLRLASDIRERLDALEELSPVVAGDEYEATEKRYRDIYLVGKAIDLSPEKALPAESIRLGGPSTKPASESPPAVATSSENT